MSGAACRQNERMVVREIVRITLERLHGTPNRLSYLNILWGEPHSQFVRGSHALRVNLWPDESSKLPMGGVAYLNLALKMCLSLVAILWPKIEDSSFCPDFQHMAAFYWYDFWKKCVLVCLPSCKSKLSLLWECGRRNVNPFCRYGVWCETLRGWVGERDSV